jgi:hypothetical protein
MGYQINWLVDKRVLYVKSEGVISLDELREIFAVSNDHLQGLQDHFYILVDMENVSQIPNTLFQAKAMIDGFPAFLRGRTLIFGMKPMISLIINAFTNIVAVPIHATRSYTEAVAYIIQHSPDLADQLTPLPRRQ